MRILAVDTATATASAALIEDGQLIAEATHSNRPPPSHSEIINPKGNHAEVILPLIEAVLSKASASLQNLSGLAVSIGPGSFTGLRIGLSTVKGLGYGLGIPVVGVSTLLANAARVNDFDGLICSLLDARKREVYAALFRRNDAGLTRITEDKATGVAQIIELTEKLIGAERCLFIGDGSTCYEKWLIDTLGDRAILSKCNSYPSLAAAVGSLGANQLQQNRESNLGSLVPVYLRSSGPN
jgi:tRNA threonylcarbamoyladenosine biosynthesis protein TsaB